MCSFLVGDEEVVTFIEPAGPYEEVEYRYHKRVQ